MYKKGQLIIATRDFVDFITAGKCYELQDSGQGFLRIKENDLGNTHAIAKELFHFAPLTNLHKVLYLGETNK